MNRFRILSSKIPARSSSEVAFLNSSRTSCWLSRRCATIPSEFCATSMKDNNARRSVGVSKKLETRSSVLPTWMCANRYRYSSRSMTTDSHQSGDFPMQVPSSFQIIPRADKSLNIVFGDSISNEEEEGIHSNILRCPMILSPVTASLKTTKEMLTGSRTIHMEDLAMTDTTSGTECDDFVQSVASEIEKHYAIENSEQFVGGMGENDGGVWILSSPHGSRDTLEYWAVIRDVIQTVKQNRHGIPFGLYTSGIINGTAESASTIPPFIHSELNSTIGLSSIQVSLLSYTPDKYASVRMLMQQEGGIADLDMSQAQKDFGQVCNFIVNASESGFPVVAAVAGGEHAKGASELAIALGAVDVVVYDQILP